MKVKRVISKYDGEDSLIGDFKIDHIPVAKLREILNVASDDQEVLRMYKLSKPQLAKLMAYIPELTETDIESPSVEYFYESFSQ